MVERPRAASRIATMMIGVACLVVPAAAFGARLYDNTGNPANTYYSAQGGAEAIDDVHLVSGGALDSLVFEYLDPAAGGVFSATATLYANPGGLDLDLQPLAGPFVVNGLARGRGMVAIPLPAAPAVGAHLWVGVKFTSTTAGLILRDVPSAGSSHDLYYENGGFYWFGGNPKANFGLRLVGVAENVSVGERPAWRAELAPARPNPFRTGTTLRYALAGPGHVRLEVRDAMGRTVRHLVNDRRDAGAHREQWSGMDHQGNAVPPGVYFVRLEVEGRVTVRRVVHVR